MKKKLLFVVNVDSFFISHRIDIGIEAIKKGYEVHLASQISKENEIFLKKKVLLFIMLIFIEAP